jgi:prephenate dehydrogenase
MALRARGWYVTGSDVRLEQAEESMRRGALDDVGEDPAAEIVFVATPVSSTVRESRDVLRRLDAAGTEAIATDVGSVKASIAAGVDHPRFIGGHPMAGSELAGASGADAMLFEGCTWVLTPTAMTDPDAYAKLQAVISSLGASVIALSPEDHDELVAIVSHVPHLTAAALMTLAARSQSEHAALLRLAAGGFRDMTRVAAAHPGIWLDICKENSAAIVAALGELRAELKSFQDAVHSGDTGFLAAALGAAARARSALPAGAQHPADVVEVRVPVADEPGVIASITTLASGMGVNIEDLHIEHSFEGDRGTLVLVAPVRDAGSLGAALRSAGHRVILAGDS